MLPEEDAVLLVDVSVNNIGWTGLRTNMALVINMSFLRSSLYLTNHKM